MIGFPCGWLLFPDSLTRDLLCRLQLYLLISVPVTSYLYLQPYFSWNWRKLVPRCRALFARGGGREKHSSLWESSRDRRPGTHEAQKKLVRSHGEGRHHLDVSESCWALIMCIRSEESILYTKRKAYTKHVFYLDWKVSIWGEKHRTMLDWKNKRKKKWPVLEEECYTYCFALFPTGRHFCLCENEDRRPRLVDECRLRG